MMLCTKSDAIYCMCKDAVGMWSIPAAQRPAGQAMLVVTMHLLGDVPSPPLVGAIQGAQDLQICSGVLTTPRISCREQCHLPC